MSTKEPFYKTTLEAELAARIEKNPRYSMRAFAKALRLSDGALSEILSGKRVPALKAANKILLALELSPEAEQNFMASLAAVHRTRGLKRLSRSFREMKPRPVTREFSIDLFRVISEWYHVAILELTYCDDFKSEPKWIAAQLGISLTETKLAIDRLLSLNLLMIKEGRLQKSTEQLTTGDKHLTTPALKKLQKQFLEKAAHSLQNDPIELRNHSAMTMAIDVAMIPLAKQMIETFMTTLCQLLESGKRQQIYNLGVVLYPIQNKGSI